MSNITSKLSSLYGELRRRKILNTFVLYIVTCWVILQVCSVTFPIFSFEKDYFHWLLALFIGLCPIVLTISWFYNLTIHGFVRVAPFTERRMLNNIAPFDDRRLTLKTDEPKSTEHKGWFIFAETGPLEGLEYHVNKCIVVGRAIECDITLLRSFISRNHAQLNVEGDVMTVEDMGSANGINVNGKRIRTKQELHDGDEIRIKDIIFRVREFSAQIRDEELLNQTTLLGND